MSRRASPFATGALRVSAVVGCLAKGTVPLRRGRFISEDPSQDGGNRYSYCEGNSVGRVDADGMLDSDVWAGLRTLWQKFAVASLAVFGGYGVKFLRSAGLVMMAKGRGEIELGRICIQAAGAVGSETPFAVLTAGMGSQSLRKGVVDLAVGAAVVFMADLIGVIGFAEAANYYYHGS